MLINSKFILLTTTNNAEVKLPIGIVLDEN